MNKFIVKYFNVCPKTYRRSLCSAVVSAYDSDHAKRVIDRHPSLIVKTIKIK